MKGHFIFMLLEKESESRDVKLQLQLHSIAKDFRQDQTSAEQKLWQYLRGKKLNGLKFKRQHPLFHYIVDFYCHAHSLVIEADGKIHAQMIQRDHNRDTFLQQHGFTVLRFTNEQILNDITTVLSKIITVTTNPPSPAKERVGER